MVKFGRHEQPLEQAREVLGRYTRPRVSGQTFFAFPYYDEYESGAADNELNHADLLAPNLLNASVKLTGYAWLLDDVRDDLEQGLASLPVGVHLADAPPETIRGVAALYRIVDERSFPAQVDAVTLSKVLHRKRPALVPLYDPRVRQAYVGDGLDVPLPPRGGRTWQEFMPLLARAMASDLRESADEYAELVADTQGRLTPLRVLDILAWCAGRA